MDKLDMVKKYIEDNYITKDGDFADSERLIDMIVQCNKEDNAKRRREGLKKLKQNTKRTFKKRRDFKMVFDDDSVKNGLTAVERGIYDLLCSGVDKRGSSMSTIIEGDLLIDSHRKLFSYLQVGYPKGKKALQTLMDRNLIQIKKFGNRTLFYVNPRYHRYGNEIDSDIAKMFKIPSEEFE